MVDIMTNYNSVNPLLIKTWDGHKNVVGLYQIIGVIPGNRIPTPPWIISRSLETKQK